LNRARLLFVAIMHVTLVVGFSACAVQPASSDFSPTDPEDAESNAWPIELGVNVAAVPFGQFWLDGNEENWDSGYRLDFEFRYKMEKQEKIEPFVGGYLFYEEHDWDEGNASVEDRAVGVGGLLGILYDPAARILKTEAPDDRKARLTLMPFSRLGVGFENGEFKNYPVDDGFTSGDLDRARLEGALGFDARLEVGDRLAFSIGTGADGWISGRVKGETRDGMGVLVDSGDGLSYYGWDLFVRAGLTVRF
jgi:hypothetical protein